MDRSSIHRRKDALFRRWVGDEFGSIAPGLTVPGSCQEHEPRVLNQRKFARPST